MLASIRRKLARAEAILAFPRANPPNDPALSALYDQLGTVVGHAKALVQTSAGPFRFDLASKRIDAAGFPEAVADSRIVVIGQNLDRIALYAEAGAVFPGFIVSQADGQECGTPAGPV